MKPTLSVLGLLILGMKRLALTIQIVSQSLAVGRGCWAFVCHSQLASGDHTPLSITVQGRYAEADQLCLRAIDIEQKTLPPNHPDRASSLNIRAGLLMNQVRAVGKILCSCSALQ